MAVLLDADQVTCDGNAAVLVFGGGGVFVDIDLSRFVGTDFVYGIGFLQRLALRNIQVDYGVVFCNDSVRHCSHKGNGAVAAYLTSTAIKIQKTAIKPSLRGLCFPFHSRNRQVLQCGVVMIHLREHWALTDFPFCFRVPSGEFQRRILHAQSILHIISVKIHCATGSCILLSLCTSTCSGDRNSLDLCICRYRNSDTADYFFLIFYICIAALCGKMGTIKELCCSSISTIWALHSDASSTTGHHIRCSCRLGIAALGLDLGTGHREIAGTDAITAIKPLAIHCGTKA